MMRLSATLIFLWAVSTGGSALAQDFDDDPLLGGDDSGEFGGEGSVSGEASASAELSGSGEMGAGGSGGGLGVGVQAMLEGPFGAAVIYDPGPWHIEGILGFFTNGQTALALGGRFYYHLHSSTAADFSVGGGLGIVNVSDDGDGFTDIHLEAGAQVRAFVVPNVAVSASLGLAIVAGDGDLVALTGQLVGGLGISYFF
jgi:hypothetical protein